MNVTCIVLTEMYPVDSHSYGLFSDLYVILLFGKAKIKAEKLDFIHQGLILSISSLGLEAYKTSVLNLQICITLLVSYGFL